MKVEVKVILRAQVMLPEGAVCRVELRDESVADGATVVVARYDEVVRQSSGIDLLSHTFLVEDSCLNGRDINLWGHLSLRGKSQIEVGDFITMQAYPVSGLGEVASVVVELQPVSS